MCVRVAYVCVHITCKVLLTAPVLQIGELLFREIKYVLTMLFLEHNGESTQQ